MEKIENDSAYPKMGDVKQHIVTKPIQFDEFELETKEDYEINSLIMVTASDVSEKLTKLECKCLNIPCWKRDKTDKSDCEVLIFADEAQEIYNVLYSEQMDELYALVNNVLKLVHK